MPEAKDEWIVSKTSDPETFEPVKDGDGRNLYFNSLEEIASIMRYGEATDLDLLKARCLRSVGVCRFCGAPIFRSFDLDYKYQCFECDQDYYVFEQEEI